MTTKTQKTKAQCIIGLEGCLRDHCRYFEGGECAYRPGVKNDGKEKASSTQGKSGAAPGAATRMRDVERGSREIHGRGAGGGGEK